MLPPLLARFISRYPQVRLSLFNGNSRAVEAALQEHRIDLGLVEGVSRQPSLKYISFLHDELVAVTRASNRLERVEEVTLGDLPQIPLVLRERGSGTLDVFERALSAHGVKLSSLNVLLYLGGTESIKLFLKHSDCMGVLSVRSVREELATGLLRVVEIKDMPMNREFSFVCPQGEEEGLAQVFVRFALQYAKDL